MWKKNTCGATRALSLCFYTPPPSTAAVLLLWFLSALDALHSFCIWLTSQGIISLRLSHVHTQGYPSTYLPLYFGACAHMCVCVWWGMEVSCTCVRINMYPEAIGVLSWSLSDLLFGARSLTYSGAGWFSGVGWPESPREALGTALPVPRLQAHAAMPSFSMVSVVRDSSLYGTLPPKPYPQDILFKG